MKHDKPEPPKVQSLADLALLSAIRPGQFPDNLIGQPVVIQVKHRPCTLGVCCDEAGVCYAAAHGEPQFCPREND